MAARTIGIPFPEDDMEMQQSEMGTTFIFPTEAIFYPDYLRTSRPSSLLSFSRATRLYITNIDMRVVGQLTRLLEKTPGCIKFNSTPYRERSDGVGFGYAVFDSHRHAAISLGKLQGMRHGISFLRVNFQHPSMKKDRDTVVIVRRFPKLVSPEKLYEAFEGVGNILYTKVHRGNNGEPTTVASVGFFFEAEAKFAIEYAKIHNELRTLGLELELSPRGNSVRRNVVEEERNQHGGSRVSCGRNSQETACEERRGERDSSVNSAVKMMQKMGWIEGQGLGKMSSGCIEPLMVTKNLGKAGLGTGKVVPVHIPPLTSTFVKPDSK